MARRSGLTGFPIPITEQAFFPTSAVEETCPREMLTDQGNTILTTQRQQLQAIALEAGQVINSITLMAGATAGSGLSNQWFSLLTSARVQVASTTDDGATGWSAWATKTLSLAATFGDGVSATSTAYVSATAAFTVADQGKTITGTDIPAGTTITTVTNATTLVLSQATTGTHTGNTFTIGRLTPYTVPTSGLYYVGVMVNGTVPSLNGVGGEVHANGLTPIIAGIAADTGLTLPKPLPFTAGAITASAKSFWAYLS